MKEITKGLNYWIDDVIITLSWQLLGLAVMDYYGLHSFSGQCVFAILNAIILIWLYYKKHKD